jgi:hypothetical protein
VPIIIDATHIELTGSTFGLPWVSGGRIGGSLDDLSFSLDSISTSAIAALSAFGPTNILGFFTGPNIEAILETSEQDADGPLVFIAGLAPMTDSQDAMCSVGYRMRPMDVISYTTETQVNTEGDCPQQIEARFAKARLRIPAGSTWRYARGIRPDVQEAGRM